MSTLDLAVFHKPVTLQQPDGCLGSGGGWRRKGIMAMFPAMLDDPIIEF